MSVDHAHEDRAFRIEQKLLEYCRVFAVRAAEVIRVKMTSRAIRTAQPSRHKGA